MYPAHFGLTKSLFDAGIAQDAGVFRSPKREPITANLKIAFTAPSAIVTLSGTAGVGKTTLISTALRASTTRLALAWLNGTPTNATELLELLLVEFGINAHRATRIERLQMWRQFLSEMSTTESRVFIVVERTEDLAPEVLRALDALTAADTNGCAGANVVLLGNEGLDEHLLPPLLESLRQRVRLRQRLTPFTVAELEDYLRHHVARAGGEFERLFAPGTVVALHTCSAGIARVVNNLCDTALTLAASDGQSQLTPELVTATAASWLGVTSAGAVAAPANEPAGAAEPGPSAHERSTAAPVASIVATAPTAPTAVVVPATPTPLPAPMPAVATEPTEPAIAAAPAAVSAAQPLPEPATPEISAAIEIAAAAEFDGGATDNADMTMADFPVLTDAVDDPDIAAPWPTPVVSSRVVTPATPPDIPRPSAAPTSPERAPAAAARPAALVAPPAVAAAGAPAKPRVDTAYAPQRPAAPIAATPDTPPAPAKPAATSTPQADDGDADELRQTQTMRAISVAKSIDDISNSMAETLFGEADLDMLSAALASAGWSESDTEFEPEGVIATPATAQEPPKPKAPAPIDDPFDLFDLGPDAPLELIDDSAPSPSEQARKAAMRR